jgi:XTP/dITP diphosphohydrolase
MRIYLASNNAHKAREFESLAPRIESGESAESVEQRVIEVRSAKDIGGMPPVIEDAGSFVGNARIKAQALRAKAPQESWVLADDSGLCVDALGGGPGVESAYFAGPLGDAAANLAKLVAAMREVPDGQRGARFVCVLVLLAPDGREAVFEGACAGSLLREPRGGGGFGYDPLFIPEGFAASFAELPAEAKNRIGHRGRAWAALVEGVS